MKAENGRIIDYEVHFKEEVIDKHVRKFLKKKATNKVMCSDLFPIRKLAIGHNLFGITDKEVFRISSRTHINNVEIKTYDDIVHFKALNYLHYMGDEAMPDVSDFPYLTDVTVSFDVDMTAIKKLKNLRLIIGGQFTEIRHIETLNFLDGFEDLISFSCSFMYKLVDISALGNCNKMKELDMMECSELRDYSPISKLVGLEKLDIHNTDTFSDISFISSLENLQALGLYSNNITNVSPLRNLKKLRRLNLENNPISDWEPVSHVINVSK